MTLEFEAWPKTPRLNRGMIITEKIDGTNAAIIVQPTEDGGFVVGAQSRKRIITPGDDNYGFAAWVHENAVELSTALGPGRHYGEWWGSGIQRGYGLPKGEKRFSLFNVARYADAPEISTLLHLVPTLYEGPFDTDDVNRMARVLAQEGSHASPGFMRPEGVIVFHAASNSVFKVTCENDEAPKGISQ